jgi:hypothetical protein
MAQFADWLERRDQPRTRRELPCTLLVEERRHRGLVRDVSTGGLYVQTPGDLSPGSDAIVSFRTSDGQRFVLEASVPYRRAVSHSLAAHSPGGVGLRIQAPPAGYRRWVEDAAADGSS